jgi:hypothetical protein
MQLVGVKLHVELHDDGRSASPVLLHYFLLASVSFRLSALDLKSKLLTSSSKDVRSAVMCASGGKPRREGGCCRDES